MNFINTSLLGLFFVCLFIYACHQPEPNNYTGPESIETGQIAILTIDSFILKDYEILASKKADINGDGFEDVVVIQKNLKEETLTEQMEVDFIQRPMMILLGDVNGSLNLEVRNDEAIYCYDCGGPMGDPFSGLYIDSTTIILEHYGGSVERWTRSTHIQFKDSLFIVQSDKMEFFNALNPDEIDEVINRSDSTIQFVDFNIYD